MSRKTVSVHQGQTLVSQCFASLLLNTVAEKWSVALKMHKRKPSRINLTDLCRRDISLPGSRCLWMSRNAPQKERLLTTELHSFLIVLAVYLRSIEQTNQIPEDLNDVRFHAEMWMWQMIELACREKH